MTTKFQKGFTLIELLIVIGILAVLATVTVLVLNPGQLFAQARDSQRISDVNTLKDAISLFVAANTGPDMDGALSYCPTGTGASVAAASSTASLPARQPIAGQAGVLTVNGLGWVPLDFSTVASLTGATPLSNLPRDPSNTNGASTNLNYQYFCDNTLDTFELNTNMESTRYNSGTENKENSDGGDNNSVYEVGTQTGLNL